MSDDLGNALGQLGKNQSKIYDGVRSIKTDTSQIKKTTQINQALNLEINKKASQIGKNQAVSYSSGQFSQRSIYMAVGGVSALVTGGTIVMKEGLKQLSIVVGVGIFLILVAVGVTAWWMYEKLEELKEIQKNVNR